MKRDMKLYLQDIWDSILAIEEYTKNLTEDEFYLNRQVQDAIIRRLEIVGEAVKKLEDNFIKKYPQIEWNKIAGMRDIVAHEYFGVKLDRVWDSVKNDLPQLKQKLHSIVIDELDKAR